MIKLIKRTVMFAVVLSLLTLTWASSAQDRKLAYDDWYGDVKKTLADHYTGKTVRLRMGIPATRRGLELVDGSFERKDESQSAQSLAQPGDELIIKSFKVRDNNIEVLFNNPSEKPKARFFRWPTKQPRINLRFSRELTVKDMTIESINRWLSTAVDITSLTPVIAAESVTNNTQASVISVPEPAAKSSSSNSAQGDAQGLPMPSIVKELTPANPDLAELTVESSSATARVYIDDAYSGFAPRTVKLRTGVHSILVMANGYAAWEQQLFIPGGKASVVKAELQR